jgi:hypothetical protein
MTAVGFALGVLPFVVICLPLGGIWALNTLFGLGLAFSFKNWLSVLVLSMLFGGSSSFPKSSS